MVNQYGVGFCVDYDDISEYNQAGYISSVLLGLAFKV